ncbi:MAG: energy transducer TonB [Acidobacteriia bacterium]|nr:energy transducer TonB [Terriglobia bacterium]
MSEQINQLPEDHLAHLLTPASLETPWYKTFLKNVKEAINPPKLPPLVLTSKPLDVPELWAFYQQPKRQFSLIYSVLTHVAILTLILWIGSLKPVQKMMQQAVTTLIAPDLKPYLPAKQAPHGGGGGGARQPIDASKGKLPKIAPRQFTPPRVDPVKDPKLPMTPTIVADAPLPNINAENYGDPLSKLGVPSNGTGWGGGIGSGIGGGVGVGKGPGVGPGSGGGFGGGAYRIGGGVSPPSVLSKVEPEYSEEARKAKWQGTVVLQLVVDEHGLPQQMKVTRSLGLGLDQKAIEAVGKWRFKPGMKDGKPVPVIATIEVNFRLL